MDILEAASIRAAWLADFEPHLPLMDEDLRLLYGHKLMRLRPVRGLLRNVFGGVAGLFGSGPHRNDALEDVPRALPMTPPY